MILSTLFALAASFSAPGADPIRIGMLVVSPEVKGSPGAQSVAAARLVVDKWTALGDRVELVVHACADEAAVAAAVSALDADGTLVLVAPLEPKLAEATRRAARQKIPTVSFVTPAANVVTALDELFDRHFQTTRIALAHDAGKEGKELAALLEKGGLRCPAPVVCDISLSVSGKALAKTLQDSAPELMVVDGDARAVTKFLREAFLETPVPLVFTPRAFDAALSVSRSDAWVVQGRSMETLPGFEAFRAEFVAAAGPMGFGATEGFEALSLIQRAVGSSPSVDRASLLSALAKSSFEGPRGRVELDPKLAAIVAPLAVWRVTNQTAVPYAPGVIPLASSDAKTAVATAPDPTLGVPLGTWRARQFELEEDTQWVVCRWAVDPSFSSIDDDLSELGLSTRGASPIFDHIVKDELMARLIAITNTKFLRNEDGTPIAGKSFKISFSIRPPKKSAKFWWVNVGGDHPDAGGEAFGTYCNVYSTFIRRTIFQPHALKPPAGPDDLKFVDGTYRYGTDRVQDKRSETIRALINGYAGSMALTTAHEVGHLCTLDHVTDDPADIMNVNEGGGLDHNQGRFGPTSYPRLVKVLGLSSPKK